MATTYCNTQAELDAALNIAVHENAEMPEKVKARGVTVPCYEVDINGKKVGA